MNAGAKIGKRLEGALQMTCRNIVNAGTLLLLVCIMGCDSQPEIIGSTYTTNKELQGQYSETVTLREGHFVWRQYSDSQVVSNGVPEPTRLTGTFTVDGNCVVLHNDLLSKYERIRIMDRIGAVELMWQPSAFIKWQKDGVIHHSGVLVKVNFPFKKPSYKLLERLEATKATQRSAQEVPLDTVEIVAINDNAWILRIGDTLVSTDKTIGLLEWTLSSITSNASEKTSELSPPPAIKSVWRISSSRSPFLVETGGEVLSTRVLGDDLAKPFPRDDDPEGNPLGDEKP